MTVAKSVQNSKRAIGTFINRDSLEQAITELNNSGFPMKQVSIVGKQHEQATDESGAQVGDRIGGQDVNAPGGFVKDALAHSTWGSILVGLGSLAIPGLGIFIAAGSLATALAASVAGMGVSAAASANLVNVFKELGIPQAQAQVYSDRLQTGSDLIILEASDEEINQAASILSNAGVQDWGIYDLVEA